MAVVASAVHARGRVKNPWLWVGLVSFGSAYLYAAMRVASGWALYRSITAPCASIALTNDQPCSPLSVNAAAGRYVLASVLIALALAVPGVVLATAGRRTGALVPLGVAALATLVLGPISWLIASVGVNVPPGVRLGLLDTGSDPTAGFWAAHALLAGAVDVVLIALPAAAIMFVVRPRARRAVAFDRAAAMRATLVCAAGIGITVAVAARFDALPGVGERFLASATGASWIVPYATMIAFGVILGTDRRWWPAAVVVAAVLLSGAPTQLLISQEWGYSDTSSFATVLPLAIVGMVAAGWGSLAARWSPSSMWAEGDASAHPPVRDRRWAVTAANGVAAGLLALAVAAAVVDPLPAQLTEQLPTYLGLRVGAQDLRAKMNLQEGLAAMDSFRAARGTYAGFDAGSGHRVEPALAWQNGRPTDFDARKNLVVHIIVATPRRAELLALSETGTAFCIREDRAADHRPVLTYGSGMPPGGVGGPPATSAAAVSTALAACGSIPWSRAAVRAIDVSSICRLAPDRSMLICQAAKRLVVQTLWRRNLSGV